MMEGNNGFEDLLEEFQQRIGSLLAALRSSRLETIQVKEQHRAVSEHMSVKSGALRDLQQQHAELQQKFDEQTLEIQRLKMLTLAPSSPPHSNYPSEHTHEESASQLPHSRRRSIEPSEPSAPGVRIQVPPFERLYQKGDIKYVDLFDGELEPGHRNDGGASMRESVMTFGETNQRPHTIRPHKWSFSRIANSAAHFNLGSDDHTAEKTGDIPLAMTLDTPHSPSAANTDIGIPSLQKGRNDSVQGKDHIVGRKRPRELSPDESAIPHARPQHPVCQPCWSVGFRCPGGKQCPRCKASSYTCVYKFCRHGAACNHKGCIYVHPGRRPEDENSNVEEGSLGLKATHPAPRAPLPGTASHPAAQGPFPDTVPHRGNPVCVHCWETNGWCDFNGTCAVCRRDSVICVRKRCCRGGGCMLPRCPLRHPGQWDEADKTWTVEDGRLPEKAPYGDVDRVEAAPRVEPRVEDPRSGAPRRGDYWRPGDK